MLFICILVVFVSVSHAELDCRKLTSLSLNSSGIIEKVLPDTKEIRIDWAPAIIPRDAAKCFSEAKLHYGKENANQESCQ